MTSLVDSLKKVDRDLPFSISDGFQTHPGSLREMLRIMNLPKPELSSFSYKKIYEFSVADPQGIAYAAGNTWFLSSQWQVFEFEISGSQLYSPTTIKKISTRHLYSIMDEIGLSRNLYDHIGDVHFINGVLILPIRRKNNAGPHLLVGMSTSMEVVSFCEIPESSDSWCVINPWNGMLYLPNKQHSDRFDAYDVTPFFKILPDRSKWGQKCTIIRNPDHDYQLLQKNGSPDTSGGFQGCFFSPNGRLYLPRAQGYKWGWHNYLHVYETLTGDRLDVSPEYDYPATWDEIEGISIHPSGIIFIAVADNDLPSTDEFFIYVYRSPGAIPV